MTTAFGLQNPPSREVVARVADAEGVDPLDLRMPLFEAIDPDALDTVLLAGRDERYSSPVTVEFRYHGYVVTVRSDGRVELS
ncbi:HalOD1 output domain-containing protein [Haloarcula marina]|uniref:HalOD1 output domain-containing protein n=1 Tax=Haloarcula marina TaxID=2961574 RepID=UPI0020B8E782|nr:HalOD1 output domain-containing protein [Halomicroarcula marina]